jgi:hypothetical protein
MASGPGLPPTSYPFKPDLHSLAAGQTMYRIEKGLKYVGNFNDREDIDNRFSSIFDNRKIIPALYCAKTIEAAIFESILRDTPTKANHVISRSTFDDQYVVKVNIKARLRLVSLRGAGLKKLGLMEKNLIHCGPRYYFETRAWAESLYAQSPTAQGLIWASRQLGPDCSIVLFGSRIKRGELSFSRKPKLISATIDIDDFALNHGMWVNDR